MFQASSSRARFLCPFWGSIAFFVPFLLALALLLSAAETDMSVAQTLPNGVTPAQTTNSSRIEDMKLISAGSGWVLASDRLFWTSDNGANWADITPPDAEHILGVFFLDQFHGWSISRHSTSAQASKSLSIFRTNDGGSTWTAATFDTSSLEDDPILGKGAHLYFSDPRNGWATIRDQTSTNFDSGIMIRTQDGGKTWSLLPTPPSAGDFTFTDAMHGWLTGGPAGDKLWSTNNGGQSWIGTAIKGDGQHQNCLNIYGAPVSFPSNGVALPVTEQCTDGTYTSILESQDIGTSWHRIVSRTIEDSLYGSWSTSFAGDHALVVHSEHGGLHTESSTGNASSPYTTLLPKGGTILAASFVDAEKGWILYRSRQCQQQFAVCKDTTVLLMTEDGGASFQSISQRLPLMRAESQIIPSSSSPSLAQETANQALQVRPMLIGSNSTVYQGEGFDTCVAPSPSQMQAQWGQSYNTYGVYIGGDNYSCKTEQLPILTSAWTSSVTSQGWGLVPIWVGYQASCVSTAGCMNGQCTYISTNSSTAISEGQQAADAAVNAAQAFGMNSTIIYYDMESYTPGATCSASVTAFVNSWVQELHSKGYDAGIYGDPKNAGDWSSPIISNQPDAAWLAAWNTYNDVANQANSSTNEPITYSAFQAWPVNMRLHQWCNSSQGGYPYTCPDQSAPSPISAILSITGQQGYDDDAVNGPVYSASSTPQKPTVTSFNIAPTSVTVGATLTATIVGTSGSNPLTSASLMRTTDLTGSSGWNPVSSTPVSGSTVNVTLTDTPPAGTFLYGAHITDNTGLFGTEPSTIQVTVNPATTNPTITSFVASPTTVTGGGTVTYSITLSGAAPSGGASIPITSSATNVIPNATVSIPAGSTTGSNTVVTQNPPSTTNVMVTASYGGTSPSATVTVNPATSTTSGIPVPSLLIPVVPASTPPSSATTPITLRGTGFTAGSVVYANQTAVLTVYVDPSTVQATLPASVSNGTWNMMVTNSGPPHSTSNSIPMHFTSARSSLAFTAPSNIAQSCTNGAPFNPVVGDFNNDGNLDIALTCGQAIDVLIGNGNGSFTQKSQLQLTNTNESWLIVGDANGDGIQDIVTYDYTTDGSNTVGITVFLGNGDGTFTKKPQIEVQQSTLDSSSQQPFVVGDFNGDGHLDIALLTTQGVDVLLGNGDGTFGAPVSFGNVTSPTSVAIADFNGDGKLDIAMSDSTNKAIAILFGNGDGTFQTQTEYSSNGYSSQILVADFNGDGHPDIAMSNQGPVGTTGSGAQILLNNGNGAFASPVPVDPGQDDASLATDDINGDGKLDIVVYRLYSYDATGQLLPSPTMAAVAFLGNGDGTFSSTPVQVGSMGNGGPIILGDFNNDGAPDILSGNSFTLQTIEASILTPSLAITPSLPTITAAQPISIAVTVNGGAGNPTPTGTIVLTGGGYTSQAATLTAGAAPINIPANSLSVGTDTLTVTYTPDASSSSTYNSTSSAVSVTVTAATTTTTLTASPTSASYGASVTLTAMVTSGGTPVTTGTVTFYNGSTSLGTGALNASGVATLNTTTLPVGGDSITASYAAQGNYAASTSTASTVTVTGSSTMITPTVTATPSLFSITAVQAFSVAVTVSGGAGNPTPTGTVTLTGGGYTSPAATLTAGAAPINIPANSLSVGTDTLTVTYTPDVSSSLVYNSTSGTASVTVAAPASATYSMTATAVTVAPGATTGNTSTVTVSSTNGYAGTVTLACSISNPAGATDLPTCSVTPTTVTLNSGTTSGTATVTINTTAASTSALAIPRLRKGRGWGGAGEGLVLALLVFLGIPARRRRLLSMFGVLVVMVALGGLAGCGGGSSSGGSGGGTPGTTSGTYTATVTGTGNDAAKTTATTTFTLTVN